MVRWRVSIRRGIGTCGKRRLVRPSKVRSKMCTLSAMRHYSSSLSMSFSRQSDATPCSNRRWVDQMTGNESIWLETIFTGIKSYKPLRWIQIPCSTSKITMYWPYIAMTIKVTNNGIRKGISSLLRTIPKKSEIRTKIFKAVWDILSATSNKAHKTLLELQTLTIVQICS